MRVIQNILQTYALTRTIETITYLVQILMQVKQPNIRY